MLITIEKKTLNGFLLTEELGGVHRIRSSTAFCSRDKMMKPVIWVIRSGSSDFKITFNDVEQRDRAVEDINNCSEYIRLTRDYFDVARVSDEKADELVTFYLTSHIRLCVKHLIEKFHYDISALLKTDAFCHLNAEQLIGLQDGVPMTIERKAELWAKTLYVPPRMAYEGISCLQFFKYLK